VHTVPGTRMLNAIAQQLDRYMTLLSARQTLVASNIANADTPGYKTKDIDFQSELSYAIAGSAPTPEEVGGLTAKNDGNNVDLDRESRLLAENDLHFSIASNLLRSQLKIIRTAIDGGSQAS